MNDSSLARRSPRSMPAGVWLCGMLIASALIATAGCRPQRMPRPREADSTGPDPRELVGPADAEVFERLAAVVEGRPPELPQLPGETGPHDEPPEQTPTEPSEADAAVEDVPVDSGYDPEASRLGGMLLDRPEVPVVYPGGGRPHRPPVRREILELQVVARPCRIERVAGTAWYCVHLLEADRPEVAGPRLIALPGPVLEAYLRLDPEARQGRFRVSGDVTAYQGVPFLLLRALTHVQPASGEPAASAATQAATAPAAETAPDSDRPGESILEALRSRRPGRVLRGQAGPDAPPPAPVAARSGADADAEPIRPRRAGLVVDRLAHVQPAGADGWPLAVFVSDNTLREAPMRLLPNRLLGRTPTGEHSLSGEVFIYRGRGYLLLRKAVRHFDMNQF